MADIELIQSGGRNDKPQVWRAWRSHNELHVEWGQLNGKLQKTRTKYDPLNVGKKNERSGDEVAQDALDRLVKLKTREGYTRSDSERLREALDVIVKPTTFVFDKLPSNLCFYKPVKDVGAKMQKLVDSGEVIYTRKRDGEMFAIVVNSSQGVDMYSRRMHPSHDGEDTPWAERFPHIVDDVKSLGLPPNTVLLAEMIMDRAGMDDFRHVTTVTRALTKKALDAQKKGKLSAYVWDIAFINGDPVVAHKLVGERLDWIESRIRGCRYVLPVDMHVFDSGKEALAHAKKNKWEGWVVVNPEAIYGDRAFNLKGKPDRPPTSCKMKPDFEGDFHVDFDPANKKGAWGKGKKEGGVGAVAVYAYEDASRDRLTYIGDCGTGLTDEQVKKFAKAKWPMLWQIEYKGVTPAGKLRHPVFVRVRDDKDISDCDVAPAPDAVAE